MAITQTKVTGRVALADDLNPTSGVVEFTLSGYDTFATTDAVILNTSRSATIDPATGEIDIDLFPNGDGGYGTHYVVRAIVYVDSVSSTVSLGFVTVPQSGPVDLNDILQVNTPAEPTTSEYAALLTSAVTSAQAAATSAALFDQLNTITQMLASGGNVIGKNVLTNDGLIWDIVAAGTYTADDVIAYDLTGITGQAVQHGPNFTTLADVAATQARANFADGDTFTAGGYAYKLAATGATDHHMTKNSVKLYVVPNADGFYPAGALGLDETGVTDIGSALVDFAEKVVRVELTAGASYRMNTRQTLENTDNLRIRFNGAKIVGSDDDGILYINNCDGVHLEDPIAEGAQTRVTWEAFTEGERTQHRHLIEIANSEYAKVVNFTGSGKSGGLFMETSPYAYLENIHHNGIFGTTLTSGSADAANIVTNPNWGFGLYVRNGKGTTVINATSFQASGSFLTGASNIEDSRNVRCIGGWAREHHDTGYYFSTGIKCLLMGVSCYNGLGTGQKMRGSYNKIVKGYVEDCLTLAFTHTGHAAAASVDSQGACGAYSFIDGCTDVDCSTSARIDQVTLDDASTGYMRDSGIRNHSSTGATQTTTAPIIAYGVKNIAVECSTIEAFAGDYAINLIGQSGTYLEGAIVRGCHIRDGDEFILLNYCDYPEISDNTLDGLTEIVISNISNTTNLTLRGNKDLSGASSSNRFDIRGLTGVTAIDNRGVQIFANTTDKFYGAGNEDQSITDVTAVVPSRIGQVVKWSTGTYIAKDTTATSDWAAL